MLTINSLGDSGFVVAREGKIVFASPSQTHYFNCPLQLQMVPRHLLLRTGSSDLPSDAACTAHVLRTGDVVVFATDGVWDNVSSQDILRVVTGEMVSAGAWRVGSGNGIVTDSTGLGKALGEGIQGSVARAVVAKAKAASEDDKLDGPFAKEVKKAFPGEVFRGGKVDDICVVSCVVGDAPPLVVEVPIKAKL